MKTCNNCQYVNYGIGKYCDRCGTLLSSDIETTYYAGFWVRLLAHLIDGLILFVPTLLIKYLSKNRLFDNMLTIIMDWLYFACSESSAYQGTLGKRIMRLKVTDDNGNRVSFGKATGRYFGKFISVILLGIGYLMISFHEKKQGLHDLMAGTFVLTDGNATADSFSAPISATEKACPMCAEKVKIEAKICRFCRFDFAKDEQMKATDFIEQEIENNFSKKDLVNFDSIIKKVNAVSLNEFPKLKKPFFLRPITIIMLVLQFQPYYKKKSASKITEI